MNPPAVGSGCSVTSVATGSRSAGQRELADEREPVDGLELDVLPARGKQHGSADLHVSRSSSSVECQWRRAARSASSPSTPSARQATRCAVPGVDRAAAAGAGVGLRRPARADTGCTVHCDAAAHLGALPAREQALERVVAGRVRATAVRPRHGRQYQPALLRVVPRAARRAVAAADVAEAPGDLRRGVGLPVGAGAAHLAAGKRLRDAVGTAAGVVGVDAPAGFLVPQRDEAGELVVAPAACEHHLVRDRLRGPGVGRHERRTPAGRGRSRRRARHRDRRGRRLGLDVDGVAAAIECGRLGSAAAASTAWVCTSSSELAYSDTGPHPRRSPARSRHPVGPT